MSKPCIVGINNITGGVDFASSTVNQRERIEAARQGLDVVVVSGDTARKGLNEGLPPYQALLNEKSINHKVINWFATGRTGLSSCCLAVSLVNQDSAKSVAKDHPRDPADLERCLLLLNAVPELRDRLSIMKSVSKEWNALIDQWEKVEATFKHETGFPSLRWNSAPQTYELMQTIYRG